MSAHRHTHIQRCTHAHTDTGALETETHVHMYTQTHSCQMKRTAAEWHLLIIVTKEKRVDSLQEQEHPVTQGQGPKLTSV
jgi:hypothetical protein